MFTSADPLTRGVLTVLISILMGTCLLVVVAIFLRWQKTDHSRYVQSLQDRFRPYLTPLLSGTWTKEGIDVLRRLPPDELEVLFDPLFTKGESEEHHPGILLALCTELGLVERWQRRMAIRDEIRRPTRWWRGGIRAANRGRVHAPAAARQGHPQPGGAGP